MQKIPENVKIVLKSLIPLLIAIILFVIVGNFGFTKISDIRSRISKAERDQKILTQKLDILRNVEANGEAMSNIAVAALPDSNPSLSVISQLKTLAGMNGVILSEIKAGASSTGSGIYPVSITFNVSGSRAQINSFITGIDKFAPISVVERIKIIAPFRFAPLLEILAEIWEQSKAANDGFKLFEDFLNDYASDKE